MKTILFTIITILALVMSGCSNADSETEMPDIVFMKCTEYEKREDDPSEWRYSLTFIDKSGDYYSSDSSEICFLSDEELVEHFKAGDERISKASASCDVNELRENYKTLLKVSKNKEYALEYPEVVPSVEYDHISWYGMYYDKDGNLSKLLIHERKQTEIDANDDRANEIYEWYRGAAKTQ